MMHNACIYLISVVWKSTYVKIIQRMITTNNRGLNLDTLIYCPSSIFLLYVIPAPSQVPRPFNLKTPAGVT